MISYQECLVPVATSPYVWVAYQSKKPYLPIAVADTARELAQVLDIPENNIVSVVSKHRHGKIKRPRYMCVHVGEE